MSLEEERKENRFRQLSGGLIEAYRTGVLMENLVNHVIKEEAAGYEMSADELIAEAPEYKEELEQVLAEMKELDMFRRGDEFVKFAKKALRNKRKKKSG